MDGARCTKKMYQATVHKEKSKGTPKGRWKNYVEKDIRKMGIVNWR